MSSFPIERVVTLATPLFAAGAAMLTGFLSTKLGVHVNSSDVEGVMAAAFLGSVGIVYKWLHGRQIPEIAGLGLSQPQVDQVREEVQHHLAASAPAVETDIDHIVQQVIGRLAGAAQVQPPPLVEPSPATVVPPAQ